MVKFIRYSISSIIYKDAADFRIFIVTLASRNISLFILMATLCYVLISACGIRVAGDIS